jgi:hypothetical protein
VIDYEELLEVPRLLPVEKDIIARPDPSTAPDGAPLRVTSSYAMHDNARLVIIDLCAASDTTKAAKGKDFELEFRSRSHCSAKERITSTENSSAK